MKTWHWIALGVGAFAIARAVNTYRATHTATPGAAQTSMRLSWLEGFEGVVGLAKFPSIIDASGIPASMLPTPQPAAGQAGHTYGPGGIFTNPMVR